MSAAKMKYQPRNILITGGAGFIGANFIHYFLKQNKTISIINLDLLTYAGSLKYLENLPVDRYQFVQGDICDFQLVATLLRQNQIDTIIHFAAESHVDRSITGPAQFIQTNVIGTFTLLEAARQVWLLENKWDSSQCRFHHISTDEVYGSLDKNAAPFTEQHRYEPNSPYSASKAGSDHLVHAYFNTYQLPISMTNCSNNYGPYQHPEKFIPTVIRQCFAGKNIPLYGDGSNIRDWLFVLDHCAGIEKVITEGTLGETYNIGGHFEMSNLGIAHEICHVMDRYFPRSYAYSSLISFVPDRPGHDWRYAIDTSKIQKELN